MTTSRNRTKQFEEIKEGLTRIVNGLVQIQNAIYGYTTGEGEGIEGLLLNHVDLNLQVYLSEELTHSLIKSRENAEHKFREAVDSLSEERQSFWFNAFMEINYKTGEMMESIDE